MNQTFLQGLLRVTNSHNVQTALYGSVGAFFAVKYAAAGLTPNAHAALWLGFLATAGTLFREAINSFAEFDNATAAAAAPALTAGVGPIIGSPPSPTAWGQMGPGGFVSLAASHPTINDSQFASPAPLAAAGSTLQQQASTMPSAKASVLRIGTAGIIAICLMLLFFGSGCGPLLPQLGGVATTQPSTQPAAPAITLADVQAGLDDAVQVWNIAEAAGVVPANYEDIGNTVIPIVQKAVTTESTAQANGSPPNQTAIAEASVALQAIGPIKAALKSHPVVAATLKATKAKQATQ